MYSSLKDKSNKFVQFTIDTKDELQRLVDYLAPNDMLRYRGVNESKYTMLTSLQRELQDKTKEEQLSYFSHLLGRVKENEKIQCFLFNLFDGEMPLEDNWNMRAKKASNHSSAQECGVR